MTKGRETSPNWLVLLAARGQELWGDGGSKWCGVGAVDGV